MQTKFKADITNAQYNKLEELTLRFLYSEALCRLNYLIGEMEADNVDKRLTIYKERVLQNYQEKLKAEPVELIRWVNGEGLYDGMSGEPLVLVAFAEAQEWI